MRNHRSKKRAIIAALTFAVVPIWAQNLAAPPSLKRVAIPQPAGLDLYVKSRVAAIQLGKALFWDMQVGSDAVQACASCHFQAGADNRYKNAVDPGLPGGDTTYQSVPPNGVLSQDKFPFTQFLDPNNRNSPMIRSWNDAVSSQGVYNTTFAGQPASGAVEKGIVVADPVFNAGGLNTRRVEPLNAPTVINAVFNFNNFWNGRADSHFNGSSPLGDADPEAGVWVLGAAGLEKRRVSIPLSSLASQAVGPPGSPFEMSFAGRTFADIGKKLLNPKIVPLGKQNVHPLDSVLGALAKSTVKNGRVSLSPGLTTTYSAMVKAAFPDQYWNSPQLVQPVTGRAETFTQMEANFAFFFGLAVQLYEATLVSDDSPFDRFQDCLAPQPGDTRDTRSSCDPNALSQTARNGLNIFLAFNDPATIGGNCIACHGTSTFSNASVMHIGTTNFGTSLPEGLIERMIMADGGGSWYDSGYYDIAVRPISEDPGRGGDTPFKLPDGRAIPLAFIDRAMMAFNANNLGLFGFPIVALPCGPLDPFGRVCPQDQRISTKGAFKVPTLRNVELTGPYMHTGGEASLMQVMDFYARGGNFAETNISTFDPDVQVLCGLNGNPDPLFCPPIAPTTAETNQKAVIDFMLSLTDERVRWEKAPFDHPELFVPNGAKLKSCGTAGQACDELLKVPAVGAGGRAAEGLPKLGTFLNLSPYYPLQP